MGVILTKNYPNPITDVEAEIRSRLASGLAQSFIYAVPTKRKVRDLQRSFIHEVPGAVSPAFRLFTLETLAVRLHESIFGGKKFLAGPTQAIIMQKAFEDVREHLQYFSVPSVERHLARGTFRRLIEAISFLKESGIYPVLLHAELSGLEEDERPKLRDILCIYEKYDELLGSTFIDVGGIYKELNQSWDSAIAQSVFRKEFPSVDAIFVAGFDEFFDPEITMLHHVAEIGNIGMVIGFDYHTENDELFGHLRENYKKFLDIGFSKAPLGKVAARELAARDTFREDVARSLFRRGDTARADYSDRVTLFDAADREAEVVTIARLIKRLALEHPEKDLSTICVAMYKPSLYTNLFREVFARYGIPANVTDRYPLDQSSLVVAIISLLRVAANNFRHQDVLRSLSSPYFDLRSGDEPIDSGNLYQVAAQLKIVGGRSVWEDRINQHLKVVEEALLSVAEEFEEDQLRHQKTLLTKALDDIRTLDRLLERFYEPMTPVEFKGHLINMLNELNVSTRILSAVNTLNAEQIEKETRAYSKFLSFLDEYLSVLQFQATIKDEPVPARRLDYYLSEISVALSQVRYNIRQQYGIGVYVTALEETRGLEFDVMFIPGLVEGEFPPAYSPEVFLNQSRQKRKERYHLTERRYLFYQGLTNFSSHLYFSYPRKDGELELLPSSFIEAVTRTFDCQDWRKNFPEELATPIYSKNELMDQAGRRLGRAISAGSREIPADVAAIGEFASEFSAIHHMICVERSRMLTHDMPEYEGFITNGLDEVALKKIQSLRNKTFSVSQLETYAACPFSYFVGRLLRLHTIEEFDPSITPIERGNLLHTILYEFYLERRNLALPPLFECTDEQYGEAIEQLLTIAKSKLDKLEIPDALWEIEKEEILGGIGRQGMLRRFLEAERELVLEVKPAFFEVSFGDRVTQANIDPELGSQQPIDVGTIRLRGKVDRVDVGPNCFSIIDYKTGSVTPALDDFEEGLSLQLPIYLYVIERILKEQSGKTLEPGAGIYYELKSAKPKVGLGDGEYEGLAFRKNRGSKTVVDDGTALQTIIDRSVQWVERYVDSISQGRFPLTTPEKAKKACIYCDFKRICRIQIVQPGREE